MTKTNPHSHVVIGEQVRQLKEQHDELLTELKAHQQALKMLMDALDIDSESTYFSFKSENGSQIAKITFAELQSRSSSAIAKATSKQITQD